MMIVIPHTNYQHDTCTSVEAHLHPLSICRKYTSRHAASRKMTSEINVKPERVLKKVACDNVTRLTEP
jgi:hypothetical protein